MRRSTSAEPRRQETAEDPATAPEEPTEPPRDQPVPGAPRPTDSRSGASRPADMAREALRAARARGAHHEGDDGEGNAEGEERAAPDLRPGALPAARIPRRSTPRTSGTRRTTPPVGEPDRSGPRTSDGPAGGVGASIRSVGALLADGFRLPSTTPPMSRTPRPEPQAKPQPQTQQQPQAKRQPQAKPQPQRQAKPQPQAQQQPQPQPDPQPSQPPPPPPPERAVGGETDRPAATSAGTPEIPRTMASPRRDGELRRTFPALPAPAAADSRSAGTWWGNAWVTALEEGAMDAARLARGRGYARTGHVDAITVTPGLVLAYVQGSRPRPYRAQVRLRTLDDTEWDRFLDAAAERPAHIAALLDKEMPQTLTDCGIPLLPGPHDLEAHCSCPDRGHPCKHAAALCYETARLLDADPFVLLLLRGRGERELLDALSRRSAARAARAAQEREPEPLPGTRAADALTRRPLPLPAALPPPPHPEQPPAYPSAPGGPDPLALDHLATDAAVRAHALLTTGRDPVGGLTLWQDAVRLAAARPGSGLTAATRSLYASLASAAGRTPAELARAVAAWRQGGAAGLAVLEEPWDPPAGRFDRARPLLLAADLPAFRPHRNRLTHPGGRLQLRLGREGLWYAYESEPGREDWWPRGTPDLDPVGALTGLEPSAGL
ncbi:SWIM zinc finger family protein [Streptomyces sp. NPDC056160]|uniref:SWIM zinc finger family protein n=1 Tax=Streptomyces sp. NPDC056160 TaxID=3345731 RepID=UPI0035D93B05